MNTANSDGVSGDGSGGDARDASIATRRHHPAVQEIPAFSDNYIWMLDNGDGTACVVDPGDARPVEDALAARDRTLAAILITHHHFDHVGGIKALKDRFECPVYGPENPAIEGIDHVLRDGDRLAVGAFDFDIFAVPGHTLDHIAYYAAGEEPPLLFCGDTLFAAGCGRLFEGSPRQMLASLGRLAALPADTGVYCAHEYTLANLKFALAADPHNVALKARMEREAERRAAGIPTVPSTVALERDTNPFLRVDDAGIVSTLHSAGHLEASSDPEAAFAALRRWKDEF